ncbi:hypothetical protein GCM10020331_063440 [Ectobacillus funiculus]
MERAYMQEQLAYKHDQTRIPAHISNMNVWKKQISRSREFDSDVGGELEASRAAV